VRFQEEPTFSPASAITIMSYLKRDLDRPTAL